jgi:hypothetical protein
MEGTMPDANGENERFSYVTFFASNEIIHTIEGAQLEGTVKKHSSMVC